MKEEILIELRNKLESKRKNRDEKTRRCKELEENEFVKEYMALREITGISDETFAFDEKKFIMDEYFWLILKNKGNKNEIYRNNNHSFLQQDDDGMHSYETYTNIETGETVIIRDDESKEFEKTHIILTPKKGCFAMRQEYVMDAVNVGQEEATKNMVKKYGRNE